MNAPPMPSVPSLILLLGIASGCTSPSSVPSEHLLSTRHQTQSPGSTWNPVNETRTIQYEKTAVILCDLWDDHWCRGAATRVAELAPRVDQFVKACRTRGATIIHAPSSVTDFYAGHPARNRARHVTFNPTPVPLSAARRWGTGWCWPDEAREPALPIDDSDMGCDCDPHCTLPMAGQDPWSRQINTIAVHPEDYLSDEGQEVWNILRTNEIDQVLMVGVHLNMCVLGRPFGIRQLVALGVPILLVRDLTDTMYNSRKRPFVSHYEGTDLVIEHVERHFCPTITSDQVLGGSSFRFAEDPR